MCEPLKREEEILEIEEGSEGAPQKVPIEKVPFRKIMTSVSFLAVCYSGKGFQYD